jgi:DNA-binding response OmpR family regulator
MKILLVNSDLIVGEKLRAFLIREKCDVELVQDFFKVYNRIETAVYDCVVIAISKELGNCDTLLTKMTNENRQEGIILLMDLIVLENRIKLFEAGADDLLTHPFDEGELFARIKAIVRRKKYNSRSKLYFANLVIDFELKRVFVWNNPISLTKKEYEILLHLIANKNRVLSKEDLAAYLWSDYSDKADSFDFVFAHLKNLKRKLKEAKAELIIKNNYGVGYQIEET